MGGAAGARDRDMLAKHLQRCQAGLSSLMAGYHLLRSISLFVCAKTFLCRGTTLSKAGQPGSDLLQEMAAARLVAIATSL
jgi:hypothetical protein